MSRFLFLLVLLPVASQALAKERPAPPSQYVVECHAPFAKSASHASLVKHFGAKNVTIERIERAESEAYMATVLFAKDPQRRLEIEWHDEKNRRRPSEIKVFGVNNTWVGPLGIKTGMTIQEIEARAGKPFKINGFGFDVEGAGHFEETALEKLPGGCTFGGYFDVEGGGPPRKPPARATG